MSTVSINQTENKPQKVVLIFGPTAVGKTEILLELMAGEAEVVSADSLQAYRGLDIGTAKPEPEVLSRLPHHLIDIRDPDEQYNAGEFVAAADRCVGEIASRDRLPVVSGGTPFYLRNFIYGLPQTPPGDPAVRSQIEAEVEAEGADAAHARLARVDPETAARLSPRDNYRIKRALEVYRLTGKKLSCFSVSYSMRDVFDMLLIGFDRPRDELNRRIELRVNGMFQRGLVGEVASLISAGYTEGAPAMQGIGYREFLQMRQAGCITVSGVRDMITRNTCRFAKRQRTFFRRFPDTCWFHPSEKKRIAQTIERFLKEPGYTPSPKTSASNE